VRLRLAWALLASAVLHTSPVHALPVPIGTQTELAYGISGDHPWITGGGDRQRAHRARFAVRAVAPRRVFEVSVGAGRLREPVVDRDGSIYVCSGAGLVALEPSGQVRFSLPLGLASGPVSITPGGDIAMMIRGVELARISSGGELRARRVVGAGIVGSPLVLDDASVVLVDRAGRMSRVDAAWTPLFRRALDGRVSRPPALTPDGQILVAQGAWLRRFTPALSPGPSVNLGSPVVAGPALAPDGSAWVITSDGRLVALDAGLRVRFERRIGPGRPRAPALAVAADGSVRVSSSRSGLRGFSAEGEPLFARPELRPLGLTVDSDGTVVTVDAGRSLLAVAADGRTRWSVTVGLLPWAPPVVGPDGTLYLVGRRGTLAAWR